jgi:hypothetical protein
MTTLELADVYERVAIGLRKFNNNLNKYQPIIKEDNLIGAALLWSYLRDMFTSGSKENFTRSEFLVLLDIIQRDPELVTPGVLKQIADSLEDEGSAL